MDNSLYIALSRQTGLQRHYDVVANNIANMNTTGYRNERMLFEDYVVKADIAKHGKDRGQLAFTQDVATVTDPTEGPITTTGRAFDVAIQGKGFFSIRTPLGERYTRSGNFTLDNTNTIVTTQGYPVLDAGGEAIVLPEEMNGPVTIGDNGVISVNGEELGQLNIAYFENEQVLEKTGDSMFNSPIPPGIADNARVVQGALEMSNVNSVKEMTEMLTVSRDITRVANLVSAIDELQTSAIRTLAKQQ